LLKPLQIRFIDEDVHALHGASENGAAGHGLRACTPARLSRGAALLQEALTRACPRAAGSAAAPPPLKAAALLALAKSASGQLLNPGACEFVPRSSSGGSLKSLGSGAEPAERPAAAAAPGRLAAASAPGDAQEASALQGCDA